MKYKGYTATVVFDEEACVLHGEVVGTRDVITFEAISTESIEGEFRRSVDDYLEMCKDRGEGPDQAYSGKILLRIDPSLHRALVQRAKRMEGSLNGLIVTILRDYQDLNYPLIYTDANAPKATMSAAPTGSEARNG